MKSYVKNKTTEKRKKIIDLILEDEGTKKELIDDDEYYGRDCVKRLLAKATQEAKKDEIKFLMDFGQLVKEDIRAVTYLDLRIEELKKEVEER